MFQYISCYSLSEIPGRDEYIFKSVSIHLMLLFIEYENFGSVFRCAFQYISCYSLSLIGTRKNFYVPMFQYISCYSLSVRTCPGYNTLSCFNTSHVTLYRKCKFFPNVTTVFQYISCYSLSAMIKNQTKSSTYVSIHLMLLFIKRC